ncbi:hypothetical protein CTA2_8607 [Colletotrichum tanaceti]|uniref:Uncharacterized protein n=1 Tax=Colletotrichum tanaceti TaxID=1306861 RepID=A0A4U6XLK4_9PEZI|nr:hypothetical protein CTA2_8607 [Colletotrichum tanaceti]TKW56541.1 hypothetical protein CTA1_10610 [Colletotrichum tanaceti]
MCLTNNSTKLCGTLLSFYESKPKKQRGFRWCVRTRATILFALYTDRILPSDTNRLPITRLRAECNILADDPAWAFVLPYFDKLVQHYATKWVKEPSNGALVSWSAVSVSGCQWDERQTAGWAAGGVDAVEAWMRQTLGKTDWWQGEQPGLVEQLSGMSLQAPPNPEKVPPQVNHLSSRANDPAPAPETPNAWASLGHDFAFNPWGTSEAAIDPVAGPLPHVVPTLAGPTPCSQPAPAARLAETGAETGTVVSAPFSTVGTNTVISAPASTVYTPLPQTPQTSRHRGGTSTSTVVSSPFSTAGTNTVISSPASTVFTPQTSRTISTSTMVSSPPSTVFISPRRPHAPRTGNSTVVSSRIGTTVVSRRPSAEYQQPSEAFTQALQMHCAAQRMMVEAEMAMKEHGLFGYVEYQ